MMGKDEEGNPRMVNGQPCILAIDLGTSGPKLCIINIQGEVLVHHFAKTSTFYREDRGVEQDPKEWWAVITDGIHKILKGHPDLRKRIVAISCSAQWSGTVPVDDRGEALGYAITWMDARGAPYIQELIGGGLKVEGYNLSKLWQWVRKTGGAPAKSGKDSLGHILYLKEKKTYAYAKAYKFLEPKDFLNLKFTGKYAASFDSIALHWVTDNRDINNICYDKQLLHLAGIDRHKLPDLYKATDVLGPIKPELAKELGLSPLTQVIVGSPDLQAAAVGSGALLDYAAHLNVGSSSWLSCHVPFKKTDFSNNMATLPSGLPGRYFVANEQEAAGLCLHYLWETFAGVSKDLEGSAPSFERLDLLAKDSVPGSRRVIFTPWLNGERTPVENHHLRGGFHNLSLQNTSSDIVRSVYEGVAYNSKWLLASVEQFIKRKLDTISMIGGGANSDLWCQIHADVLNRKILQVAEPRFANVRGAAWIGAVALGYLKVEDIPSLVKIKKEYVPSSEDQELYNHSFREFLAIYKSNKNIYQRLNTFH